MSLALGARYGSWAGFPVAHHVVVVGRGPRGANAVGSCAVLRNLTRHACFRLSAGETMPGVSQRSICPQCGSAPCVGSFRRQLHQQQQMRNRSGPEYEKAVSRSRAGTAAWRAAGSPRKVTAIWLPTRDPAGNLEYDARGTLRCERRWYVTATIPKTRGGTHEFRELVHFSWVADPAADVPGWAESMVRMMREQMPLESVEKLLQQLREWATPDRVEEQLRLLRVDEWVEATPEQVKAWTAWAGSRPGPGTASRP